MRTFKIGLGPTVVGGNGSSIELIEAPLELEVNGLTARLQSGVTGDYLIIETHDKRVSFTADWKSVRYCYVPNDVKVFKNDAVKAIVSNVGG